MRGQHAVTSPRTPVAHASLWATEQGGFPPTNLLIGAGILELRQQGGYDGVVLHGIHLARINHGKKRV